MGETLTYVLSFRPFVRGKSHRWRYLVYVVVVDDAVEAFVDVVQHVHHFHRRAVLAQSGEAHNVAEIYGHLVVQLRLHHAGLLQAFHHWAAHRKAIEGVERRSS